MIPSSFVPALANVGIPLLPLHVGASLLALLPVVLLEAALYRRWLGVAGIRPLLASGAANVITTLVGVPLAWVISGVGFGILPRVAPDWPALFGARYAAWIPSLAEPFESSAYRMYPTAVAALLPICLWASIMIERPIASRLLHRRADRSGWEFDVNRAVIRANVASYGGLLALCLGWSVYAELATVPLTAKQAQRVLDYVDTTLLPTWISDDEPPREAWLKNENPFGPPRWELWVRDILSQDRRDGIARGVDKFLRHEELGPLRLTFYQRHWIRHSATNYSEEHEVLSSRRLDGRRE